MSHAHVPPESGEARNPTVQEAAGFKAFLESRLAALARRDEEAYLEDNRFRQTPEERALRAKVTDRILSTIGIQGEHDRLKQLMSDRVRPERHFSPADSSVVDAPLLTPAGLPLLGPASVPSSPVGEMWWARTVWFFPPAQSTVWFDDDGFHFTGKWFSSPRGDLWIYRVRITAWFELSADRMPIPARYVSAPVCHLTGRAYGYTGGPGFFVGDRWSKCWLNTRHTVFVSPPALPPAPSGGISVSIGPILQATDSRTLIFIEGSGIQRTPLPGFMAMPVVALDLPPETPLVASELEWQFEIQLEAEDAAVWLGHHPHEPVCTLKHYQWHLKAI
jgi:hypothetical protein